MDLRNLRHFGIIAFLPLALFLVLACGEQEDRRSRRRSDRSREREETAQQETSEEQVWNDRAGLEYVYIQPGDFMMGAVPGDNLAQDREQPRHRVTISRGFMMSRTEVTVRAYRQFCGATGRSMPSDPSFNRNWSNLDHPIVNVTWHDAAAYCEWAGVRLPTEAEWEYACRAGTTTIFYWGDDMDGRYAWYSENSGEQTHDVGQKLPNAWGLYDMSGNAWEWCSHGAESYGGADQVDPRGPPSSGDDRVFRGGSWFLDAWVLRISYRDWCSHGSGVHDFGFRCIRDFN